MVEAGASEVSEDEILEGDLAAATPRSSRSSPRKNELIARDRQDQARRPAAPSSRPMSASASRASGRKSSPSAMRIKTKLDSYAMVDDLKAEMLAAFGPDDAVAEKRFASAPLVRAAGSDPPRGDPRARRPPRRPPLRRDPPDHAARSVCLPRTHGSALVHARRDPGARHRDARHLGRRAEARLDRGRVAAAVHAALQLPAVLGGRGQVPARPRPPRDRPRRARRAVAASRWCPSEEQWPVHDPHRVGHPRIERLVVDGLDLRRLPRAAWTPACPIEGPVAGIAMGLVNDRRRSARCSTDIAGAEDHHGDMDFKVAGTRERHHRASRWTSRSPGITPEIMHKALEQARQARLDDPRRR